MQEYHVFRDKRLELCVARQRAILKGKLRSDKSLHVMASN